MEKCLVFDVWGNYGHFRKFYTTSSPLTHAFPPKTAIWGMVGAIIGLDKDDYLNHFQDPQIACGVRIVASVKKTRIALNLIDTKSNKRYFADNTQHTQVNMELLKRPSFRIYFYHPDETIYNKLGNNLVQHKSYYTICLGLSEYLAQFKFCGEFQVKQFEGETDTIIKSIIPMDKIDGYRIEDGFEYFQETVPAGMNPKRQPTRYQKVLYERNGKAITCFPRKYYKVESGENVIFL